VCFQSQLAPLYQGKDDNDAGCEGTYDATAGFSDTVMFGVKAAAVSRVVGRCRLPVSNPEIKARLVSALETKMWCTAFKRCFQCHLCRYSVADSEQRHIHTIIAPNDKCRATLDPAHPEVGRWAG
jgi:hypothetical protein